MTAKLCAAALSCSLFLAACPAQAAGSDTITPKIGMGKNAAATTDDPFAIFRAKVDWINSGHLSGGAKTNMTRGMATSAPGGTVPSVAFPQQAADAIKNMDIEAQAKSMKDAGISDTQVEQFKQQMENLKKQVQGGTTSAVTSSARNTGFPQQSFITQTPLNSLPDNDGMKYNQNDQEATGKWAIGVAGDMATAVFFDSVSPGLLKAAGAAVSAYPHPLVLNNYASLLDSEGSPKDALFFYFGALEMEPKNPVILTNIAMTLYNMGDLDTALGFADVALQYNPESGPALQLKTIGHLRAGNGILAAETLFKSTRDCFDGMTMALFDDYLKAVGDMNPKTDEYPINDDLLKLLYEMAKKYVDTADVNPTTDTPSAQLTLAKYPIYGDGENILNSYSDYSWKLLEKRHQEARTASDKYQNLQHRIFAVQGEPASLTTINNVRQYYAFRVLSSYYDFKWRKARFKAHGEDGNTKFPMPDYALGEQYIAEAQQKWMTIAKEESALYQEMMDKDAAFQKQIDALKKKGQEAGAQYRAAVENFERTGTMPGTKEYEALCVQLFKQERDIETQRKKSNIEGQIEYYRGLQVDIGKMYDLAKTYANKFVDMDKKWYEQQKQIFEEYWLKAGGLMKYMTDPDMLAMCEAYRKWRVYDNLQIGTFYFQGNIWGRASNAEALLNNTYNRLYVIPYSWSVDTNAVSQYYALYAQYQEKIDQLLAEEKAIDQAHPRPKMPAPASFDDDPVKIEASAIPVFKEKNQGSSYDVGFKVGDYYAYFGMDQRSWKLPFFGESTYNKVNGTTTSYSMEKREGKSDFESMSANALDVSGKVVAKADLGGKAIDFANKIGELGVSTEKYGNLLKSVSGPLDTASNIQGMIGLARVATNAKSSGDISTGRYVTKDSQGRVIDQGWVYQRQVSGEVQGLGATRTTTVMRSQMTGVTTKSQNLQYNFKFVTHNAN